MPRGPHLQAALIVERVMRESDSVPSLLRIIDTLNITAEMPTSGQPTPDTAIRVPFPLTVYLRWGRGDSDGPYDVEIVGLGPNGKRATLNTSKIAFTDAQGAELQLVTQLNLSQGQHWFIVKLNGREVTRLPLIMNVTWVPPSSIAPGRSAP
jgi:hypothetical protein